MGRGRPVASIGLVSDVTYREHADGSVEADVRVRVPSGETKRARVRRKSKRAAREAALERIRKTIEQESAGDVGGNMRLADFLEVWFSQHVMSMNTQRVYRSVIDLHIVPGIGQLRLQELTTARLERFLQDVEGAGTRKTSRAVLSGACSLAVRWGVLSVNPVRETSPVRQAGSAPRALDLEDVQRVRDAVHAYAGGNKTGPPRALWLPWLVDFVLGTGLRIGEALALRWEDVEDLDGDHPLVHITGTLVWEKGVGTYRQAHPKSDSSNRVLQLPPISVEAVRRQREDNGAHLTEWLFPTVYSTPVTLSAAEKALRLALPEELEWVEYRTIRRTVATMIANNMGTDAAMLQLGHSDSRVTLKHYLQRPETAPGGVILEMFKPGKKKTPGAPVKGGAGVQVEGAGERPAG